MDSVSQPDALVTKPGARGSPFSPATRTRVPELIAVFVHVRSTPPTPTSPGPSLFLILWVRPPEMQQEGNEVGVADHTEGAALISEVQDQCPLEGVAGQ